jgi:ribosome assembly protein 4
VLVVAWSPDAQMIASGDMDGSILLWDPKDGKLLGSCSGHKKWITSLVGAAIRRGLGQWCLACWFAGSQA